MKFINFRTQADNEVHKVEWHIARQSQVIRSMLDDLAIMEDDDREDVIPLPNTEVTGPEFKKVLLWCREHGGQTSHNEVEDDEDEWSMKAPAEKASPTLTLSHSELTHIRSALSRAKLESLAPDLKSEIVKGNICFLCTKTKFSLFFTRRHHCQLCQQSVCSKCITKAKLPEDQRFDNIPVFALSPGQSSPHLVKSANNNKAFIPVTTNSSTKVKLRRSNTLGRYDRPNSVAGESPNSNGILSSLTSISSSSNSSSPTLNVCLDCKHAVESMTSQTRQYPQREAQNNPLPDFEPTSFQQRRRFSHQDYSRRRSLVTKSLIFD